MDKRRLRNLSSVVLVAIVTVAFVWVTVPFFGAILWAIILAVLFAPLQRWLESQLGAWRNLASGVSVLACIFVVVIPGGLILGALAREATALYESVSSREVDPVAILEQFRSRLPQFVLETLAALNLGTLSEIGERLSSLVGQVAQFVASRAMIIGQNAAQFSVSLGVMLYVLFFLFRDGERLVPLILAASPLSPDATRSVVKTFVDVVKATVVGNVVIAVVQGTIGGLAFWAAGVEAALLCGVIMAVLSLLPALGAFLVWGPFSAYFLMTGDYGKGLFLLGMGVFVISTIDNLLRPPLVGRRSQLPDYVVLVSTLGGIVQFGMNGFVIGPLIAALFIAVWTMLKEFEGNS